MAKTATLHIRVNEDVKANAEETLAMLGISVSDAVNMFLCQVNLTGGLPFDVRLPAPDRVISVSKEDLYNKLEEAERDINESKVYSKEEIFSELEKKYGL